MGSQFTATGLWHDDFSSQYEMMLMSKIAVVTHPPVLGDRKATIARAVQLVTEASENGAGLIVFPEAFIPGYPTYIWRLRPGGDMALSGEIHAHMARQAVRLDGDTLDPLRSVAKQQEVDVMVGLHEIDGTQSRATLFCTYVHIGKDGEFANIHRKMMPTNPERMVWGFGDGSGIRVVDTPVGRVGSLICWENYMPLARMALYAQGLEIYIAPTWDDTDGWQGTMQHIAREGRCYVVNCCAAMRGSDIPADFPGRDQLFSDDEVINKGNSSVFAPGGNLIVGPIEGKPGIVYAEIDLAQVRDSRRSLDVAGHYNRPDIFRFEVNRERQNSAIFLDHGPAASS